MGKNPKTKVPKKKINYAVYFKNNWQLYVLILPAIIYFIVFNYMPLYGIQIAFKDFKAVFGISGSKWVGFKQETACKHIIVECVQPALELSGTDYFGNSVKPD